ncbi:MAG TPA: circularly permuted type 2 ATP-grasp protein [Terriglobia bacterium]|nr:circularly permuted type 2 ATP-grasp protein [Terriglobia bacterium]
MEGYWDEAVLPSGFPRRHWRQLSVAIRRMGFRQFNRYWQSGVQLIRETGISNNLASDPWGNERLLPLDPIPLVIAEDEWTQIEKAVIQRSALLNAMLFDLYGKQRLVYEDHLPPALVFGNLQFLRPCFGITPPDGVHLHTYAADLGRSPDGQWWVIADRTQAPAGMGYALENRLVSARTLPTVFSQYRVRQLARFFDVRRDALLALAARHSKSPRVVVLTPGPHNDTYFEHSSLAGYWGFPLVEGDDLTVREGRVYLKTLAGLEPVDLIMRRFDDSFCDPLELRGDSLLGVPGLVQAVRNGAVVIDNALGSGLIEAAGHLAFLPGLCRQLLNEDLRLPSVATWWCGQEKPRQYVLEHLDELVIKPASPSFGHQLEYPASMDTAGRENLIARIKAHPEQFVAQEGIALSTAPARTDVGLAARHVVLRVFAIWDGQSYTVMPGGLTQVTTEPSSHRLPVPLGGASKDTWVLGGEEELSPGPSLPSVLIEADAGRGRLPSRVADNLYWLGRYTERVEANVRLLRALLPALSAEADFGRAVTLETAVHLLVGLKFLPPEDATASLAEQRWRVQRFLTDMVYDPSRISSLGWNLKEMRRVAWQLKERLSSDTWHVLRQLEAEFSRAVPVNPEHRFIAHIEVLDRAVMTLSAFSGLLMENTTRGEGWRFLELGRRLERALQMGELLRAGVAEVPPDVQPYLLILLQVADSSITYRTRYLSVLRTDLVLQLLLADETNPRSVGFQLAALAYQFESLGQPDDAERGRLQGLAAKTLREIHMAPTVELAQRDSEGRFRALESLLDQLKANLYEFSEALTAQYMTPVKPSRLTSSW